MKRISSLIAILGVAAFASTAANAADLRAAPAYKGPPVAVAPAYTWTGCYVGAHIGGGWAKSDWVSSAAVNASPDADGIVGGLHLGCNYQFNSWFVLGIEGDISASGIDGSGPWTTPGFSAHVSTDWLASIRARLGVAVSPSFLLYITGGVGFADWSYNTPECGVGVCGAFSNSKTGWVLGGGFDYRFNPNWSARLEYLYYDFGSVTSPPGGVDTVATNIDTTVSVVRAGITYHFYAPAPVVTRY